MLAEQGGTRMPRPKRRRCEPDGPPTAARPPEERRLYLILDDYPWGYSIREMNLPPLPASSASGERRRLPLPPPVICFEAPRGYPQYIAAAGTAIVATHRRDLFGDVSVPAGFLPIVDVRWRRGVTFGPGEVYHNMPIFLTAGDALLSLDTCSFRTLPLAPLWPARLEHRPDGGGAAAWSWRELPRPPFDRIDVTSYAMVGRSIVFSTEREAEPTLLPDGRTLVRGDGETFPATFAFDTAALAWERRGEWAMPFAGRAHFVSSLQAIVGLSRDPDTSGHLCCCAAAGVEAGGGGGLPPAWKLGKEKLLSEDPAEAHVGATLVYMGRNEFCLVQCVFIGDGGDDADRAEELEEPRRRCHVYRLTTFSVSYDDNGDLTTGGTCQVQCYEVPGETTDKFLRRDPVAFWL
ncbi:unnamed protein product [Urochloa decumbens]|uniref:DUF295 domain-containing protein n=1 Tax=Urochloa decumbens TaxID=240449 RepID=A0ABC8WCZ9_9POAL